MGSSIINLKPTTLRETISCLNEKNDYKSLKIISSLLSKLQLNLWILALESSILSPPLSFEGSSIYIYLRSVMIGIVTELEPCIFTLEIGYHIVIRFSFSWRWFSYFWRIRYPNSIRILMVSWFIELIGYRVLES